MLKILELALDRKVAARLEAISAAKYGMTFGELPKSQQKTLRAWQQKAVVEELMLMMAEAPTPRRRSTRQRRDKVK